MARPRRPGSDGPTPRPLARDRLAPLAAQLAAGAFGFAWFVWLAGPAALDPRHLEWLMIDGDWAQHVLGWLHFRRQPLELPLGRIDSLLHPIGTTLGYSDSNPLVSFALKPLSPWLPRDFQFIGPWLAACFALQGFAGAWLVGRFTAAPLPQLAGGVVLAASPVLALRVGHDTLCAHFLLLFAVGLALGPRVAGARSRERPALLAVFAAAVCVHPYLAAMVLGLAIAALARAAFVDRSLPPRRAGAWLAGFVVLAGIGSLAFGYLGGGVEVRQGGFGEFAADALALVAPRGGSRLLPELPASYRDLEGYGYAGAGALLLLALAVPAALRHPRRLRGLARRAGPLWVVAAGAAVFSCGEAVRLDRHVLVPLDWLVIVEGDLARVLRASGRFVWIPLYVAIATAAGVLLHAWPRRAGAVFAAAAILQVLDVVPRSAPLFRKQEGRATLQDPAWRLLAPDYRHLALVPVQAPGMGGARCAREASELWFRFGYLAYREGLTVNSAYVARGDAEAIAEHCRRTHDDVAAGRLDADTVYVSSGQLGRLFARGERATCGVVDGLQVCVAAHRDTALRRALARAPRSPTPPPGRPVPEPSGGAAAALGALLLAAAARGRSRRDAG